MMSLPDTRYAVKGLPIPFGFGFGIDFYLEYFKFSPQIKLCYGFLNLLSKDNTVYTQSIQRLTTNGWMLSFTFE